MGTHGGELSAVINLATNLAIGVFGYFILAWHEYGVVLIKKSIIYYFVNYLPNKH